MTVASRLLFLALLLAAPTFAETLQDLAGRAARGEAAALARLTEAARTDPKAQAVLGTLYLLGRGVTQSYATAYQLYQRAANAGEREGLLGLIPLLYYGIPPAPYDPKRAAVLLADLAGTGLPEAQAVEAYYASQRGTGTRLSPEEAVSLWQRLLPASVCARFYLGQAFLLGKGVEADPARGQALLAEAAEGLSPCAAMAAGVLATGYWRGWWGLPKDPEKAMAWALRDAWSPYGAGVRGERYLEEGRLKDAEAQVAFWAYRGFPGLASTAMGRLLMDRDPVQAAAHLMVAYLGDPEARGYLEVLRRSGRLPPEAERRAQALAEALYAGAGLPAR